jgi:class 3 adenylate cyclase
MRGGAIRVSATLALTLACGPLHGVEPVTLDPGATAVPLAGHVEVLADPGGSWALDDVRGAALAARFQPQRHSRFNQGFTSTPYWYRFTLRDPRAAPAGTRAEPLDWVLEIGWPTMDLVDVHYRGGDGVTATVRAGDHRHADPGLIPFRRFAVPLSSRPGELIEFHIRIEQVGGGAQIVNLDLWSAAGFRDRAAADHFAYGAFFGILLVMLVYNLIIYAWIRDRAYLLYLLYLGFITLQTAIITGHANLLGGGLFDGAPRLISNTASTVVHLVTLSVAMFGREVLGLARHAPWFDRLFRLLAAFAAVAAAGAALTLIPYGWSLRLGNVLGLVSAFAGLAVGIALVAGGHRTAIFFLAGWSFLGLSLIVGIATFLAGVETFWTTAGWQIGVCIEVALFSLALGDRYAQERRQRDAANEGARRLQAFLPQNVAGLVSAGDPSLLEPRRRNVTVCVIDLRGFTPFSETAAPEDVMAVLREFYEAMGAIVGRHGGTVEHFAGDSMLIFFNAPLEVPQPERQALQTALEMREAFESLRSRWARLGHDLGLGVGVADGYATIGAIGFAGRSQYAAIGAVTNLA